MTASTIQLDYAKPPRWHQRRAFRWAMVGIAVIAVAASAWRWGPEKWEEAKFVYWQWRCLHYSAPADEVVYDEDLSSKSSLLNASSAYMPQSVNYGFAVSPGTVAVKKVPYCEAQFEKIRQLGNFSFRPPILFMHDRTAPSGRHYLIILRGDEIPFLHIAQLPVDFEALTIGSSLYNSWAASGGRSWEGPFPAHIPKRRQIYAGQADPADPSHFTIRYTEDGRKVIVDGYVDDYAFDSVATAPDAFIARVKLTELSAN